jgi:FixJ family two-component response regulator
MLDLSTATRDWSAKPVAIAPLVGVVDDDESVRDALSSFIRSLGYRCVVFSSAESFLSSGDLRNTDCTVLDVRMPGLSGLELQQKLRELNCPVPIIFVTGLADDHVPASALKEGAVAVLNKPFSEEALLGALASVLNSSRNQ